MEIIVNVIKDDIESLQYFHGKLENESSEKERSVMLDYPTVYIHNWKNREGYEVYVGESNNVLQRTKQHFDQSEDKTKWQHQLKKKSASLYIIGYDHFNKSFTLDIENRLMHYMMGVESVKRMHNKRTNPQNRYYPDCEANAIFRKIWNDLRKRDEVLFPAESAIKDSAFLRLHHYIS